MKKRNETIIDKCGKRIVILGSGGSGKTTFSNELSMLLRIPVVHLDSLYWKDNWASQSKEEWEKIQKDIVSAKCWIIDGNYWETLDIRLSQADTVLFMDTSKWICIMRILKRWISNYGRVREDFANGCKERIDIGFLRTIWKFPKKYKQSLLSKVAEYSNVNLFII